MLDEFKKRYIFGAEREGDRLYVSQLIKKATGFSDEEYIKFVEENANKSFEEIYPVEIRNEIIKIFATINSNNRKGDREYNEMYGSNPKEVMAVFAYSENYDETISNPVEFLARDYKNSYESAPVKKRTEFLQNYALEHDIPFVVFGD